MLAVKIITLLSVIGVVVCAATPANDVGIPIRETFKSERDEKQFVLGREKTVRVSRLHPIIPHLAVPLRDHNVRLWVANVPLTPFRAPVQMLPPLPPGVALPRFLMYRPELLSPVRNQGDCGTCWAFAVSNVLADRAMVATRAEYRRGSLSVQQLLSCYDRSGCDGGSPEEACLWLASTGEELVSESLFPFTQGDGGAVYSACEKNIPPSAVRVGVVEKSVRSVVHFVEGNAPVAIDENVRNMKLELIQGGPFYSAIAVYDDLYLFSGLKPYRPGKSATLVGGHAIEIIGYCERGADPRPRYKDTGYWVCKNSWGEDWPTQTDTPGYFTVVMGENVCGIESRCGFATPEIFSGTPDDLNPRLPLKSIRYTDINDYLKT